MPDTPEKFYVTTPIYYVNARPHIGHAYTTIVADVLARRARSEGRDTWFLTGTDEHGQKIERSAAAAGIAPQAFADEVSASFEGLWKRMGITNDQYIRTTDAGHKRGVQKLFATLFERGQIYLDSYTGQYSVGEEMFVEGPPGTIGPDGKPTETVTEENFFFKLSEYQLRLLDMIESDELKITPDARRNEVLSFLRGNVAEAGETGVAQTAAGQAYVPGALKNLSVSRSSFTWGIPVPEPAASLTQAPHIIYVWLDALANYMSAVGYGDDSAEAQARFARWWPADLHLVGKEIIRFHCVYWPAFLMAAGLPLPKAITAHGWLLFDDAKMSKSKGNIVRTETILEAFGMLCLNAESAAERDLFGADVLRYFLLREIPFGQDGSFSFDALVTRYNADLTNGYGNLVSRTLTLVNTLRAGGDELLVPASPILVSTAKDGLDGFATTVIGALPEEFEECRFTRIVTSIQGLIGQADSLLNDTKPWKLVKSDTAEDRRRAGKVLYAAAEAIRLVTAMLHPILPYATAAVWRQLGLGEIEDAARRGELKTLTWGRLAPGTTLGPLAPIFPRADKKLAETMIQMEQNKNAPVGNANAQHDAVTPETSEFAETPIASEGEKRPLSKLVDETTGRTTAGNAVAFDPAAGPRTSSLHEANPGAQVAGSSAQTTERAGTPSHVEAEPSGIFATDHTGPADGSPQIAIDDFAKVELRVAKVLMCERIPKADKLLRLEVDLGYEKRQILSGIAEWYTPDDLIGRRIVVITNLAPRKMRGLESHGMLLAASGPEGGKPALATFLEADELPAIEVGVCVGIAVEVGVCHG